MRWLALGLTLFAALCVQADGDTLATEHKTLAIPHLTASITVDGKLTDWPNDAPRANMALDPDAEDYRGVARLAWDARFLYVAFTVASGKGLRNAGDDPATAYKTGDTLEVFLSVNDHPLEHRVVRGSALDTAKDGDYRIVITRLRNTKPVVFGYDFVHPGKRESPFTLAIAGPRASADCTGPVPNAEFAVQEAKINGVPGFVAEIKLPWAYFRGYQPKAGARLLGNLAINFSNQTGSANIGKAYWNGPSHMTTDAGIEAQIHPEYWGWLQLLAPPVSGGPGQKVSPHQTK